MGEGIETRKADHLRIAIDEAVEVPNGRRETFGAVGLVHQALPEIDLADVDPSTTFLGKRLAFPLLIGSMTGGTEEAGVINRRLAMAASACGIGMFLGSQRVMLERPAVAGTFSVRDVAPDIPLIANFGAVQLNLGVSPEAIGGVADAVGADGVVLHLNPAQEAVQPEGDTQFAGLAAKIAHCAEVLSLPVGVKEVGSGLSRQAVERLAAMPLAFLETAGRGGTSWTLIEGKRAETSAKQRLGALFADWGIPTVTSLLTCVRHGGGLPVIASGGVRSGLDGAKAVACGAAAVAMALPLLRAAAQSVDAVVVEMRAFEAAFRTAMFLTGARTLDELRAVPRTLDPAVDPDALSGAGPA